MKSGMGKNNKPWEMLEVELDSGDTCTLFGPIKIGTEVETYEHESYGLQYRVKRVSLEKLEKQLEDLTKMVKWLVKHAQAENTAAPSGLDKARAVAEDIKAKAAAVNEAEAADEDTDSLASLFPDD